MSYELEKIKLKPGEILINEGEHSSDFFRLVSGSLAVFVGTRRVAGIDKQGVLIGEMSFFLGEKRSATVIALSDAEVEKIPKDEVLELFGQNPDFAVTVAGSLAQRLSEVDKKVAALREQVTYYDKLKTWAKKDPDFQKTMDKFEKELKKHNDSMKNFITEKSLLSKKIIDPVTEGVVYSVTKLLDTKTEENEIFEYSQKKISLDAGSIVNISGDCEGWYALAFPKDTAIKMTNHMTHELNNELNENVFGFIKEFNTILLGQIITRIKEYELSATPPINILNNKGLKKMIEKHPAMVMEFSTEYGNFYTILYIEILK